MARQIASSSLGTPPDTYLYALGTNHFDILATIGSDDSLRLFDASLTLLNTVQPCHAGVSCLDSCPGAGFVTAGRDGLIKIWDPRAKQASHFAEPQHRAISAIAIHAENCIAAGTESTKEGLGDVSVLLFDTRNPSQPLRTYNECHSDSITQLAFHPTQSNVLLSASTDGLVSILDVNQSDEDEALQQVLNPRSAVHCSGFLASDQAYVLTTDEQFSIYPLADKAEGMAEPTVAFGDVRQTLSCMYVIDILQQVDGAAPAVMAYGHNENKSLSIVQLVGGPASWSFGPSIDLPGAHGEEVVRDLLLTADQSRAFSCGEDGQVKAWNVEAPAAVTQAEGTAKSAKKKRKEKNERFQPY